VQEAEMIEITETQARIFSKLIGIVVMAKIFDSPATNLMLKRLQNVIDGKLIDKQLEEEERRDE
jgi:hypothetical protein